MVGRMQVKAQKERSIFSESDYMVNQEDLAGRSCLALTFPKKRTGSSGSSSKSGRQNSSRNSTSVRSNVSSADQSEDTQALLSDHTPQLVWYQNTTRQTTKSRHHESPTSTMDLPNVYSDSPQQQQETYDPVQSLLKPPPPVNRAPQNRRIVSRRGVYDGEVEPEGVRGQEAVVTSKMSRPPRTPGNSVERNSFQPVTPFSTLRSANMYDYPTPSRKPGELSDDMSTPSRSSIDRPINNKQTNVNGEARIPSFHENEQTLGQIGSRVQPQLSRSSVSQRRPLQQRYSDAESTVSDDDIRHMMPDLMPNFAEDITSNRIGQTRSNKSSLQTLGNSSTRPLPSNQAASQVRGGNHTQLAAMSPDSIGMSRAAQKAAAAAAAVSHTRRYVEVNGSSDMYGQMNTKQEELERINAIAMEHVHNGDYERALVAFTQVLKMQREIHGEVHAAVASAHHNLGTVYAKRAALLVEDSRSQRQCQSQALECFQAAARVARDSLGKNHPNVAVSLVRIGFLLLQSRQYGNAVVTFQEALRIRLEYFSPQHRLVANLYNNLGVCYMHLQEFEKGMQQLEKALDIQRRIVQQRNDDPWVHELELADTLFNIGGLCLEWIRRQGPHLGRAKDAVLAFQETLKIRSNILGSNDPSVVQVRTLLDMAQSIPLPMSKSETITSNGQDRYNLSRDGQTQQNSVSNTFERTNNENWQYLDKTIEAPRRPFSHHIFERSSNHHGSKPLSTPQINHVREPSTELADNYLKSNMEPQKYRSRIVENSRIPGDAEKDQYYARYTMEPFIVPEASPVKGYHHNNSDDATRGPLSEDDHFSVDKSFETPEKNKFVYEDEESFILQDAGVGSVHGRIQNRMILPKAGMTHQGFSKSSGYGPDTLMTNTSRQSRSGDEPLSHATKMNESDHNILNRTPSLHSLDHNLPVDRNSNVSTGNSDRDDIMSRARAILSAHRFAMDSQRDESDQHKDAQREHSSLQRDARTHATFGKKLYENDRQDTLNQDLMEDGIASLGGYWSSRATKNGNLTLQQMLADPTNYLPAIHEEASKLLKSNRAMNALNLFDVVLTCQRNKHGPLHPDVASALHNVGISQLRADCLSDALKSFEEAARVRKGSLGSEHPLVAVSMVNAGICLLLMRRFDKALWSFREALTVRKRALGPLHPSTARIYNNIGCVHVEFNEFKEARHAFEAALDVQRNALCHDPDNLSLKFGTATTLCNLGYLYRFRGSHAKACLVLKEATELQGSILGKSNAIVLSTLDNLADSYARCGNATAALEAYKNMLKHLDSGGGADQNRLARSEALVLYKMSRVHGQESDRQSQLSYLEVAQKALSSIVESTKGDSLERRIQYDIQACHETLEKDVREL